jgi:hypothetical protein
VAGKVKVKNKENSVEKILEIAKTSLDDGKAEAVIVIDLEGKSSIASYMIVASGTSNRHVASLAENLQMKLKLRRKQVQKMKQTIKVPLVKLRMQQAQTQNQKQMKLQKKLDNPIVQTQKTNQTV